MVGGSVLIGMGVSHLLTRLGRSWRYAVTLVLIVAWAMPNVASSLVWNWLFQPGYGGDDLRLDGAYQACLPEFHRRKDALAPSDLPGALRLLYGG